MILQCRFSKCQWRGQEDEIFEHFELQHKKYLREPNGHLYYDFNFNDLQQEVIVLCSTKSLYYFKQNLYQPRSDSIDFGVFHIGESEQIEYTLKLELKIDGHCKYWGPWKSKDDSCQPPSCDDFRVNINYGLLQRLDLSMSSKHLRLYISKFNNGKDKPSSGAEGINWQSEEELRLNSLLLEQFTCAVCCEFIRRDARFCENRHFICLECFDQMLLHKKLKCPICRGQYLYDCSDDQVERLLRTIKWPDNPA